MNMDRRRPPLQAPAPDRVPLLELGRSLLKELPGLVSDRLELLTLELRRAGQSLVKMAIFIAAAALLLITAWTALWIGVALVLVHFGLQWGWAVLVIFVLNIVVAIIALLLARALVHNLTLPATRRRLTVAAAQPASTGAAPESTSAPVARSSPATGAIQP